MNNKKFPGWLVLLVICTVAALLLACINLITEGPIKDQQQKQFDASCRAVLTKADSFQPQTEVDGLYTGLTADGEPVGFVAVANEKGYGGDIEIVIGTDKKGNITGVQIGGANFAETAGLGAKSKTPEFRDQFVGLTYPLSLSRDGGQVDAITGATITSKAVLRGLNGSLEKLADAGLIKIQKPAASVTELGDNRYATSKNGFGGPVYVELLMQDGTVAEIIIGDENFSETGGYGARAKEESFYSQYVGKTGTELKLGEDIDALSGATITSTAVNDAVNLILLYVNDPEGFAAAMEANKAPTEFLDGEYVVTANGLTSTFPVTVTIADGAVTSIALGETTGADVSFLDNCRNDAFTAQFTGKSYPVEEVEVATGATISSKATMAAVNDAFLMAGEAAAKVLTPVDNGEYTLTVNGPEGPVPMVVTIENNSVISARIDNKEAIVIPDPVEVPVEVIKEVIKEVIVEVPAATATPTAEEAAAPTGAAKDYEIKASGLNTDFTVTVSVENGAVTAVKVGDTEEGSYDISFLAKVQDDAFTSQFVGKSAPVEVDVVAGATISSKAVNKAVNKALDKYAEENPAPAAQEAAAPAGAAKDYEIKASGLNTDFTVTVSVENGAVTAVKVGDTEEGSYDISFLAKVQDEAFTSQFVGKSSPVEVDAVAGATISSKAVNKAVNKALDKYAEENPAPAAQEAAAPAGVAKDYEIKASGLNTDFMVTVSVENGAVTAVKVGDTEEGSYDISFLAKVQDEAFTSQFVGKSAPVEVDAVAGATISSKAVNKAVNKALGKYAEENPAPAAPVAGNQITSEGAGLTGTFPITVTVDNGAVVSVVLGEASKDCYDADYLAKCNDEAFLAQFVGKTAPMDTVDVAAGATISSNAILKAVNEALAAQ